MTLQAAECGTCMSNSGEVAGEPGDRASMGKCQGRSPEIQLEGRDGAARPQGAGWRARRQAEVITETGRARAPIGKERIGF